MNNRVGIKPNFEHLYWPDGEAFADAWWVKNQSEESGMSGVEHDDPDGVREVCEDVAETLDNWHPDVDCESMDELIFDLADFLEENIEWEVEVDPDTPYGRPQLLVGDKLVLEIRINPDKGERGRLVSQCAAYAPHWVTWIVLVKVVPSQISQLSNLLSTEGHGRALIWSFS